jgi:5-methylcytosine-specific restriction endonuclease McrA
MLNILNEHQHIRKSKKTIPKKIKTLVWNTYIGEDYGSYKCLCCNITKITQMQFHCGHVISESKGGEITIENLRPICSGCNLSMASTNMNDFINKHKLHNTVTKSINHYNLFNNNDDLFNSDDSEDDIINKIINNSINK